jgi:putative addiction module killer protein
MDENRPMGIIEVLVNEQGKAPFQEWFTSVRDPKTRQRILTRLNRVKDGNLGDCKSVGGGVLELRLMFGAGYRIYFGRTGDTIVVLICGGDKSTQDKDIQEAISLWARYTQNR